MKKKILIGLVTLVVLAAASGFIYLRYFFIIKPTPESLQKVALNAVNDKDVVGLIIAHVTPQGVTVVSEGETEIGNGTKPSLDTVFEIGSITKALTGLLLAQAIEEGKIQINAPAQKYLKSFILPSPAITVSQLASQTSGIPTIDEEYMKTLSESDKDNPWKNFDNAKMAAFLKRAKLEFEPGSKYAYSNVGSALVGHMLSDVYGQSWESLVTERLFVPLKMTTTSVTLTEQQKQKIARGYKKEQDQFKPVPLWDFASIEAAGAVHSTMKDMIALTQALMDDNEPISKNFMAATQTQNKKVSSEVGYFWNLMGATAFHNGGTYGMESFLAINKKNKTAILLLGNTANGQAITMLGTRFAMGLSDKK